MRDPSLPVLALVEKNSHSVLEWAAVKMSTEVSFQPIYGSSSDGPVSSLLVIDGFKILLDCGWIEPFSVSMIEPLRLYGFAFLQLTLVLLNY